MTLVSVDGVRRSDLSVLGWAAIAGASCLALWTLVAGVEVLLYGDRVGDLVIGGVLTVVLLGFAQSEAAPEIEGTCQHCGESIRTQSNRDGVDEVVEVMSTVSPRRAAIGPLSVVLQTRTGEWLYCCGDCAQADQDRRQLTERPDDGHEQTDDQGTLRPATEHSDS
ncbi:hypothetical protein [Halomicrobium katesii]|uniref:hypothetical protein n=1 Tax=Halomicrobium katesii TaxID=437163 RepID=UPI000376145A|nr:hypothetical protein [Halomicrobium katesii]